MHDDQARFLPQHIRRNRPAADEARRLLLSLNRKAWTLLQTCQRDPVGHVHRARQSFKRSRAVLGLLRPAAPYVWAVENRFYRDISRRLAGARDAPAIVEAVVRLEDDTWEPGLRQSLLMLKDGLQRRAERRLQDAVLGLRAEVEPVCAELARAEERLRQLPLPQLGRRDLRRGARRTFRRADRAFRAAWFAPDVDALHDWRKHLKHAYYQAGFMAELMPRWAARRRPVLYELADLLGHVQDLAMLDDLLSHESDELGIDTHLQSLHLLVRRTQRDSRAQALALGAVLFGAPESPMVQLPSVRGLAGRA